MGTASRTVAVARIDAVQRAVRRLAAHTVAETLTLVALEFDRRPTADFAGWLAQELATAKEQAHD